MPRALRLEYPGAIYHVMSRGNQRQAIFRDDADRRRFLAALGEACGKTGWQIHAYCLMRNHFHLDEQIRRGWCLGDEEFRQELLARGQPAGAGHYGWERRERDEAKARRLVAEHLAGLGWQAADLQMTRHMPPR